MGLLDFIKNNLSHVAPILAVAAFALAVIMERVKTLYWTYPMRNTNGFFDKISELIFANNIVEAIAFCDKYRKKPLAKLVKSALLRAHLPDQLIEHGVQYQLGEISQAIGRRTSFLATIANVATLLGLLGTILGLVNSFEAVGHADAQQKASLLAAGIAVAMNATMMGLGVAIPCMLAFSFLMNRSNNLIASMENSAIKIIDLLKQRYYVPNALSQSHSQSESGSGNNTRNVTHLRRAV